MCQQVENQAQMAMCLRHRRNAGEHQPLPKQLYRVRHQEEDAEAILDPLLRLPPDERGHLQGSVRGVWPLGDGGLQRLGRPQGTRVIRDALLHIGPEQTHRWVPQPLGQASQCLLLLTSKE